MPGADLLMIEDDLDIPILAEALADDVAFACTSHGADGVDMAARGAGLIILDLELPDVHGHDVLARLTRHAPVVVFTGSTAQPRISDQAGAIAHVRKPSDANTMERVLETMFDCARVLTQTPAIDGDELEGISQEWPGGPEAFDADAPPFVDAIYDAAAALRRGCLEAASDLRPSLTRFNRPLLLDLRVVEGDAGAMYGACLALAWERFAKDLRRWLRVTALQA